jgi:hypothetical protein
MTQKHPKFYHFPSQNAEPNRVQHASFTANDTKITVRSSYVELPDPTPLAPPAMLHNHEPSFSQDNAQFIPHQDDHVVDVDTLSGSSTCCIGQSAPVRAYTNRHCY